MVKHEQLSEIITLEQAASEGSVEPETLRHFVMPMHRRGSASLNANPRKVWQQVLRPKPVFEVYKSRNTMKHCTEELVSYSTIAFRAACSVAEEAELRGKVKRPNELLKNAKRQLARLDRGAPEFGAIFDRLQGVMTIVPELSAAISDVSQASSASILTATFDSPELSAAIDIALKQRQRRGPRKKNLPPCVQTLLRCHYLWLTGLDVPDWTNNGELRGGFITFQREIYRAAGINAPPATLLRGDRGRA